MAIERYSKSSVNYEYSEKVEFKTTYNSGPDSGSTSKSKSLPMAIETMSIITVCGILGILAVIGIVYKFACNKKSSVDSISMSENDTHSSSKVEKGQCE